jgi:hypothetical protein
MKLSPKSQKNPQFLGLFRALGEIFSVLGAMKTQVDQQKIKERFLMSPSPLAPLRPRPKDIGIFPTTFFALIPTGTAFSR